MAQFGKISRLRRATPIMENFPPSPLPPHGGGGSFENFPPSLSPMGGKTSPPAFLPWGGFFSGNPTSPPPWGGIMIPGLETGPYRETQGVPAVAQKEEISPGG